MDSASSVSNSPFVFKSLLNLDSAGATMDDDTGEMKVKIETAMVYHHFLPTNSGFCESVKVERFTQLS